MNINGKYILYGAGNRGRFALKYLGVKNVICFCDNGIKSRSGGGWNSYLPTGFQKYLSMGK